MGVDESLLRRVARLVGVATDEQRAAEGELGVSVHQEAEGGVVSAARTLDQVGIGHSACVHTCPAYTARAVPVPARGNRRGMTGVPMPVTTTSWRYGPMRRLLLSLSAALAPGGLDGQSGCRRRDGDRRARRVDRHR